MDLGSNICLGQKDRQADKQAVKYANGDWKIANFVWNLKGDEYWHFNNDKPIKGVACKVVNMH